MGLCLGCERHCHSKRQCHSYEGYIYDCHNDCHGTTNQPPKSIYTTTTRKYTPPPMNSYYQQPGPYYPYSNPNLPSRVPYNI